VVSYGRLERFYRVSTRQITDEWTEPMLLGRLAALEVIEKEERDLLADSLGSRVLQALAAAQGLGAGGGRAAARQPRGGSRRPA